MNQTKLNTRTKQKLKSSTIIKATFVISIHLLLTACSTSPTREETIQAILQKENTLIQKLKEERNHEKIRAEIARCDVLKNPESHLSESLDEIFNGNEVIINQLIESKEMEKARERFQTRNR